MNANLSVLDSGARTATTVGATFTNLASRGLHLVVDVTVVPGTDTVTPKIEAYDQVSGKWYTLLTGAALVATGTVVLKVYPGLTAVTNLTASDILPATWRVTMTHSSTTSFTYSVGANLVL